MLVAVGLAVLGGGVVALRTTQNDDDTPAPAPAVVLDRFAGDGVVLPERGARPNPPTGLAVTPADHRLRVSWAAADRAAGYQVRWGAADALDHTRLVALPSVELAGLDNGVAHRVEVRAVDAFGQRSEPATTTGTPATPPDDLADVPNLVFVDRFDGPSAPDPTRWRLIDECTKAGRGGGEDSHHLVVGGSCGNRPAILRSRTPFRLADPATADGELGRLVVDTDAPGGTGVLLLDLVPGPADAVGLEAVSAYTNALPPAAELAGRAQDDDSLPPGTIRIRVGPGKDGRQGVWTLVGAGMPQLAPITEPVVPLPELGLGVSHRWQVVLRRDGVRVLVDGELVGTAPVAPQWTEATALLGFHGGQLRPAIDLVAVAGGAAQPPAQVTPPRVVVAVREQPASEAPSGQRIGGVLGAQLRLDVQPADYDHQFAPPPALSVQVGAVVLPLRPAVEGTAWTHTGIRHPMVADLPAEALVVGPDYTLAVTLLNPPPADPAAGQAVRAVHADLELIAEPAGTPKLTSPDGGTAELPAPPDTTAPSPTPVPAQLPKPSARLLDAAGQPFQAGRTLPRGRLVLEVTLSGTAGQLAGTHLAGVAGFGVRLDDAPIATVPTAVDGPGVGGQWRVAFTSQPLAAGPHTIEVRAIGVDGNYLPGFSGFLLAP
ncbi:hypothetical protein LX83_001295 [Goodfellowiella coeruleoviolacea]|uniref:Fibronectin type-III domain-containing protein n=1 Tax=Goodfellowiella coeruleoviolacea TaxID=334858 RepID=A0AAE3GAD5_9PSEU|nr:hypothetical protein [Goodfellowiella coeruleoviolacea]